MHAPRELALDPFPGLAGIAAHEKAKRPFGTGGGTHRAHERRAEPRDCLVVQRVVSRLSANAVSAE
jgi:hypothetical protein